MGFKAKTPGGRIRRIAKRPENSRWDDQSRGGR